MTSDIAAAYKSGSQRARVVTEFWGEHNLYCPNCSSPKLDRLVANTRASDFFCPTCKFWYQLKGQKSRIGNSISDGAYEAMMAAIRRDETPSFYLMQYDLATWSVKNLLLIPHFAFPPSAIVKRNPLSETARRAGWVGCNIAINRIPPDARIAIVETRERSAPVPGAATLLANDDFCTLSTGRFTNIPAPGTGALRVVNHGSGTIPRGRFAEVAASGDGRTPLTIIATPEQVRARFERVKPLKELSIKQRGWALDVLNIVRRLGKMQFTNQDVYAFERELEQLHAGNRHIRDKIRQQLQNLARAGFLIHAGRNDYRVK